VNIKIEVGKKIRGLRHVNGLSQEQLASLCGLDRTYIAGIELGKRNVSIVNIEKIAIAFQLTISQLFEGIHEES
jgi:transcriptional regulator with XRE-family HTH domain